MKTLLVLTVTTALAAGQGSLTPPGAPAPTMKSLQEIWDQISIIEASNQSLQSLLTNQQQQLNVLQQQNSLLLEDAAVVLPWDIDHVAYGGYWPALTFTPAGRPAIACMQEPAKVIVYAEFDGATWQMSNATEIYSYLPALAFTPAGRPAIACRAGTGNEILYSEFNGVSWQSSTVTTMTSATLLPSSLAFNAAGQPIVAYTNPDTGHVMFAAYDGSSWQNSTITTGVLGGPSALKLTPAGQPAVCITHGSLVYAVLGGSGWEITSIESKYYTDASLAMSPSGHPAISLYDTGSGGDLKFVAFDGTSWNFSTVDSTGDVGSFNSLAFTPGGRPAISYHDATNLALKYASFNGSTWEISTVEPTGENPGYWITEDTTSLAFTPGGQPAIAYTERNSGHLSFAVRAPFSAP
jgi:hypothetical protein